jgi:hypothetical protein
MSASRFSPASRLPMTSVVDVRAHGMARRLVLTFLSLVLLTACSSASPLAPVSLPASPAVTVTVGPTRSGPAVTVTPKPSRPVAPARVATKPVVPSGPGKPSTTAATPAPSTLVAHVLRPVTVMSTAKGGKVVGTLTTTTRSAPTWVPVTAQAPGHVKIRFLVGRTIRTGWVPASAVNVADTGSWAEIELKARRLTVHVKGKAARTWTLKAVGGGQYPTPTGLYWTERVGVSVDAASVYGVGPFVETSARSATFLEAPIIAVHSWRRPLAVGEHSHGCARAPDAAVLAVADLALSSPVLIRP